MKHFTRISHNANIMGGKPCITGTRITIGMILIQISEGVSVDELINEYPSLTGEDISEALLYAAWVLGAREELVLHA